MREKERQKFRDLIKARFDEKTQAIFSDLDGKCQSADLLNNTVHNTNISVWKEWHDEIALLGCWIDEFCFINANFCMSSGRIKTFQGAAVSKTKLPTVFKSRLSLKDKSNFDRLHSSILEAIRVSAKIRRVEGFDSYYDEQISTYKAQELLIQVFDVEDKVNEILWG